MASEQQEENQATANLLQMAEGRIQNLETELAITKSDVGEVSKQNSDLLRYLKLVQAQQRSEEKIRERRLGRKRVNEIGPGALKKTKSAYKKRFVEEINKFGENRGLIDEKLVLRDKDGQ